MARSVVDFTDLDKACLKDSFPVPNITQLVDSLTGFSMFSFLDSYSRYNQIRMDAKDEGKTTFMMRKGIYCYKVMSFGLKNMGATYQRLVSKVFNGMLGCFIKVYIDNPVVKSSRFEQHMKHLEVVFDRLRKHKVHLNPMKCRFRVRLEVFLGHVITKKGIEAHPN